jgi:PIN domain nuclease of toxin-antitoxin system
VRLLLDTHAFVWACAEPGKLSHAQREAIAAAENEVFVSAASAWEIAIKRMLGRIEFPIERFEEMAAALGFDNLPMTVPHAIAAGCLPRHHDDPFDRILIAQARLEGHALVTVDGEFKKYDVPIFGRIS